MSDNKCGQLISVVNGWQCEKCGLVKNTTTELWQEQEQCKEKNATMKLSNEWTKEESDYINKYMSKAYEMDGEDIDGNTIDFEGNILTKVSDNEYKVYSWDMDEVYFEGTLKECMDYCLGSEYNGN